MFRCRIRQRCEIITPVYLPTELFSICRCRSSARSFLWQYGTASASMVRFCLKGQSDKTSWLLNFWCYMLSSPNSVFCRICNGYVPWCFSKVWFLFVKVPQTCLREMFQNLRDRDFVTQKKNSSVTPEILCEAQHQLPTAPSSKDLFTPVLLHRIRNWWSRWRYRVICWQVRVHRSPSTANAEQGIVATCQLPKTSDLFRSSRENIFGHWIKHFNLLGLRLTWRSEETVQIVYTLRKQPTHHHCRPI